jgi:phage terminase large subunit-like protein
VIERLAALPAETRKEILDGLSPEATALARRHWPIWARPEQLEPPGQWLVWLILAGRGWGKTRTGAEWAHAQALRFPRSRGALIGRTAADVRDTMIEGVSGLLAAGDPSTRPRYEPSKRRLTWPNGSRATCFSAEEPDLLRGPAHQWAWADELAAWRYVDAWDQLMFGLREGETPRVVVTTTPRPTPLIRALLKDPLVHLTKGRTRENKHNLAKPFLAKLMEKFRGTTLGRQELDAEVLGETPGALWRRAWLDDHRVTRAPDGLVSRVLAIDPSLSGGDEACEAGLVVAGIAADRQVYVLEDLSVRATPGEWSRLAIKTYRRLRLDAIVVETNAGAATLTTLLRYAEADLDREAVAKMIEIAQRNGIAISETETPRMTAALVPESARASRIARSATEALIAEGCRPDVPAAIREVRAREGKRARAQPISALYEQGRVHHVGAFAELEDQLCTYVEAEAPESPDRLDALVWAITALHSSTPIDIAFRPRDGQGTRWDPSAPLPSLSVGGGRGWTP